MPDFKGKLGRNITREDLEELAPSAESLEEAITELEAERLGLLLAHYQISPDSSECWLRLALALARDYVPGFQVTRRGTKPKNALRSRFYSLHSLFKKRGPGAPPKYSGEFYAELLDTVDHIKREEPSINTNKAALQALVEEMASRNPDQLKAMAKENRRTIAQEKASQVLKLAKLHSRAKNRKTPSNS